MKFLLTYHRMHVTAEDMKRKRMHVTSHTIVLVLDAESENVQAPRYIPIYVGMYVYTYNINIHMNVHTYTYTLTIKDITTIEQ